MKDGQAHRRMRWGGNLGCVAGLVITGLAAMNGGFSRPQMKLLLVAGVLIGTAIGMLIGRILDKKAADQKEP